LAGGEARGVIIQPVDVTTDMGTLSVTSVDNLINQNGLSPTYTSGVTSDAYTATHTGGFSDIWVSETAATGFVSFDLGAVFDLTSLRFWNAIATSGGPRADVTGFTLFSDADMDPNNGTSANLGSFVPTTHNTGDAPMQSFAITATTQFVHLQITSNLENANRSAFGEAAFAAAAIPEPSALLYLSLTSMVVAVAVRLGASRGEKTCG
jgi:hypothetical protein